jgi:uncharacterized LabA/DUF88 family protein
LICKSRWIVRTFYTPGLNIGTYVLASGDSDFVRLAESISARGKSLVITAPRVSSSSLLVKRAKAFWPLDELLANPSQNRLDAA